MGKNRKTTVFEEINIENVAAEGKCVARVDNQVIFVEGVAPGDVVDLLVTKRKKNFMEARPIKFYSYSEDRQKPFCAHFDLCGGCKWQHLTYESQIKFKQQQVVDNLERIAKVKLPAINPILPSPDERYYRNKLEFTFTNKRWLTHEEIKTENILSKNALGFHVRKRFDKIIDIQHCHLQPDPSNTIRVRVRNFAEENNLPFFDLVNQIGFLRNLIVRNTLDGQIMVIVIFAYEDQYNIDKIMSFIEKEFSEITSLLYVVNPKKNEIIHDLEVITFSGKSYITETMEGLHFRIGPKSFFQPNVKQALQLYSTARNFANLTGQEVVYDLYTGTGTIANFVAGKSKKVIGIEYVAEAIEDAKINSKINNISNTQFYAADIQNLLNEDFLNSHEPPDVVITDPPRAGMHQDVVNMLLKMAAPTIVYISCNPATQARDIGMLDEKYELKAVQPVDMFPHTTHVENVVLLNLRDRLNE
ncbi:23S rRNA (uracil(1939)-C(5))-methyltransferase RlmD [soil metagenome]